MTLNTLQIFDGVKTTRDYSVVQDNTKQNWYNILTANHTIVFSKNVNYYRLPDVIRIEAKYETIRNCPYGCLILRDEDGSDYDRLYFWIDHVRLLKQNSLSERDENTNVILSQTDVVELTIAEDVWSNRVGSFRLIDPYIVRKHMDRWVSETENGVTVYKPKYYPEAAQGVQGAYKQEDIEDLTPPVAVPPSGGGSAIEVNMRYIVISAVKSSGELVWLIGCDCRYASNPRHILPVWHDHANNIPFFDITNVLDGSIFTAAGISANHVQSISVVPYMGTLNDAMVYEESLGITWFRFVETAVEFYPFTANDSSGTLAWIELAFDMRELYSLMYPILATPDVIGPQYTNDYSQGYDEQMEPMLYMSPARIRKIVNGTGGTVFDLPDIAAFEKNFAVWNAFDVNSTVTFIFAGTDIKEANAIGAAGYLLAATLPIFESAWATYTAIEKVGDEIAYQAKQFQNAANGITGTASSSIMGGFVGGPYGAALGFISGAIGTAAGYHGNEEELRAKQTTIKNSPCTMKSGGSGLGGTILGMVDAYYMTLKIDDVSYDKLQDQYYFYGYYINNVIRGELSLHRRYLFDHVQTSGARVSGAVSGDDAKQIAAIFDKGVTIYHGSDGYDAIGAGRVEENYEVNAP